MEGKEDNAARTAQLIATRYESGVGRITRDTFDVELDFHGMSGFRTHNLTL